MKDFFKFLAFMALIGIGLFLLLAAQVRSVDSMSAQTANQRFREALAQFDDTRPMLTRDTAGNVARRQRTLDALIPEKPGTLTVLAWRGEETGLAQVDVPLWFLRVKGPALRYLLRNTGFDAEAWQLSVEELEDYGVGVIVHYEASPGRRVLAWTH